ncbi:MAG: hypothetical protein C0596_17000 [Marinilabiliales bacterium]|nr:MAG: hypothetical protein C0596_17000 [Marinilabiliales bacterium]
MEENKKLSIAQKQILKDLENKDDNLVLKAVRDVREKGGSFVIEPLMDVYFKHKSNDIAGEICNLFQDLKDNKLNKLISDNLISYSSNERMSAFVSALWQSSIKFEDTKVFLQIFVDGNDATSLEALTLIQQNADMITDSMSDDCLKLLKSEITNLSDFKKNLAIDLLEIFQ